MNSDINIFCGLYFKELVHSLNGSSTDKEDVQNSLGSSIT